jgi:hypothetical protein
LKYQSRNTGHRGAASVCIQRNTSEGDSVLALGPAPARNLKAPNIVG